MSAKPKTPEPRAGSVGVHFISEFRRRFDMTPRAYQDVQARQQPARAGVVGA